MFFIILCIIVIIIVGIMMYKDYLNEQEEIAEYNKLPKNIDISLEEFSQERMNMDRKYSTNDVLWSIYNKKLMFHYKNKSFGLYRNTYLRMAELLYREKKYQEALKFYLQVLYCDLSGKGNNNMTDRKKSLILAPGIIKKVLRLKKYFKESMIADCFRIKLPFHYCNEKIFSEIINDILAEADIKKILPKYFDKMKKEPKSAFPFDYTELANMSEEDF